MDLVSFLTGIKEICNKLDFALFERDFIMQDAWGTSYSAISKVFPQATVKC